MIRSLGGLLAAAASIPLLLGVEAARAAPATYTMGDSVGISSPNGCAVSSYHNGDSPGTYSEDGTSHSRTLSASATATTSDSSLKPSDASFKATSTSSVKATRSAVRMRLSASGVARTTATTDGTKRCRTLVSGTVEMDAAVTTAAGWMHESLNVQTDGLMFVNDYVDESASSGQGALSFSMPLSVTRDTYVTDGKHSYDVMLTPSASSDGVDYSNTTAPVVHFSGSDALDYFKLGQAHAAESGSGKKVVSFSDNVACTVQALPVYFQRSADKVEFTVGGKRAGTYKNVKKGHGVTLANVDPSGPSTVVEATVTDGHKKSTVSRTYYGCSS
jgi:hypothetical protein